MTTTVKPVHRLSACDLVLRTMNGELFDTDEEYAEFIGGVAVLLAAGKLVILRRVGKRITVESRTVGAVTKP